MKQKFLTNFAIKKAASFWWSLFFFFLLFSCNTTKNISVDESCLLPSEINWQVLASSIEFYEFKNRYTNYQIVKLDLTNPSLQIQTLECSESFQKAKSLKKFAKKNNLDVAINTVPFKIKNRNQQPVGIVIKNKEQFSPANEKYGGIAFYKKNQSWVAKIFKNQAEIALQNEFPDEASGGFWQILDNSKIINFKEIKDTRSAVALSEDGKSLFLFAGKNLSYNDCSNIFIFFGATDALEFDGGMSTQLYIKSKKLFSKKIHRNIVSAVGFKFD